MANVLFSRTDSPSTKPITDGQIIFDTSGNGKMYLDNGTTRLEMGGAINVDATLDATSTNPIQNKGVAGVMLSELEEVRGTTKKGFLTDALVTKTLDAKIGTTDISSIGDGTVTGAINDVNGKLVMKVEQKTGEYKNQKLNKQVIICSVTLTPGLWLIIGFIDGNISSDFIYNNTLFDQTVRESMIGGGGSTNIILRGIGTTTTVNLSTYDFANVTSDLTYRGTLTAVCLKPYSDN